MDLNFWNIITLLLIVLTIIPIWRQKWIECQRFRLMRKIEKKRGSRLITLIHRQELLSLLGIPLTKYINIEDSEKILRVIRITPPNTPIDLVLHTPGGVVLAAEQIARALLNHPAEVRVIIPHYAMSGGTLIAIAADKILMDKNGVVGPVDPQVGRYPAVSILRAVDQKDRNRVEDETLILADIAEKAVRQVENSLYEIMADRMGAEKARELARILTEGRWTHDYPIHCQAMQELGFPIHCEVPEEIYQLMDFYSQPLQRRTSVDYLPTSGQEA